MILLFRSPAAMPASNGAAGSPESAATEKRHGYHDGRADNAAAIEGDNGADEVGALSFPSALESANHRQFFTTR